MWGMIDNIHQYLSQSTYQRATLFNPHNGVHILGTAAKFVPVTLYILQ